MTKKELSDVVGLSRPTIDKRIKEKNNFAYTLLFIKSFSLFDYNEKVERIKRIDNGKTTKI